MQRTLCTKGPVPKSFKGAYTGDKDDFEEMAAKVSEKMTDGVWKMDEDGQFYEEKNKSRAHVRPKVNNSSIDPVAQHIYHTAVIVSRPMGRSRK